MDSASIKQWIKNNGKEIELLEILNCHNIVEHSDYFSASMPDGDNKSGIVLYKDNGNFVSYSRGINGDIFTLVQYINNTDFRGAINFICNIFDLDNNFNRIVNNKPDILSVFTKHICKHKTIEEFILPDDELEQLCNIEHISLLKEGITPIAFKRFNCLYNYDRQRIAYVWHRWFDGKPIGINSRTVNPNWMDLGINKFSFTKGFNKGNNLYGLWENYNDIKRKGEVVVFEAEKSVLKRASQFDYTAVALGGKAVTDEQVRILLSLNVNIIFAFDQDVEIKYIGEVAYRLNKYRNVYVIDSSQLDSKISPADLCESEYKKLYKNKKIFK